MTPAALVHGLVLPVLGIAFVLTAVRAVRGPSLPDRVVALDLLSLIAIVALASHAVAERQNAYLDVATVVALITFLGTVAFARYLERHARRKK